MSHDPVGDATSQVDDLDRLIIEEFPQPIAVNYQRLLAMNDWQKKTEHCLRVFEFVLRTMALSVISQYLIRDAETVNDQYLNGLLLEKLPGKTSLGTWQQLFFATLRAYAGKKSLFFMPELYDFYWDTKLEPHRPNKGIEASFTRLVQIRNDIAHRLGPANPDAWKSLLYETLAHLKHILGSFSFIRNYELIRILRREHEICEYMICKGVNVTIKTERLPQGSALETGWFYWSKDRRVFLQLHPLLIFWEESDSTPSGMPGQDPVPDAAIYDSFTKEAVTYLATVLWQVVSDRRTVADFIRILYYTIQEVKAKKRGVPSVSWPLLRELSTEITASQTATVAGKYRRQLYTQRAELMSLFEDFLCSDRNCFVLLGRSGVGKSSFFLSLIDEYDRRDDICLIFFDGARLEVDRSLVGIMTSEFQRRLRFLKNGVETEIEDLIFEISRLEDIQSRKVVLLIDAINENPRATDLLIRIDTLVRDNPFRWLKIAISSRPEAWQVVNRGIRSLADDRYYVKEARGTIGVELESFTTSELAGAYEKYRREFHVDTDLSELNKDARHVLSDPLSLRLIMETYAGRSIPPHLGSSQIIERYLDMMCRTKMLFPEDLVFLEQEIVPLMVGHDCYANSITAKQINIALTSDGRMLREMITSDDLLSTGKRVNASFMGLADAEILSLRGGPVDYEVVFKYERLYDHFVGRHLYWIWRNDDLSSREDLYSRLIGKVEEQVFLWGAVKQGLMFELQRDFEHGRQLVIRLAQRRELAIRDLVVATLVDFGGESPTEASVILQELMKTEQRSWFERVLGSMRNMSDLIRQMKDAQPREFSSGELARAIVPSVAAQLGMPILLSQSASDPSYMVRRETVDAVYLYWRRMIKENQLTEGYVPIRGIAERVGRGRSALPNVNNLVCLMDITSRLVITQMLSNSEVLLPLLHIWRDVLKEVPFILPRSATLMGRLSNLIRDKVILRWVGSRLRHVVRVSLTEKHPINLRLLDEWYQLPSLDREQWKTYVSYADPYQYNTSDIRQQLISLSADERPLFAVLTAMILPMHALEEFDAAIELADNISANGIVLAANVILRTFEVLTEIFSRDAFRIGQIASRAEAITLDLWKRQEDVFWEARYDVISWPMYQECMSNNNDHIRFAVSLVDAVPVQLPAGEKQERLRDVVRALGYVSRAGWGFERRALGTMLQLPCIEDPVIWHEVTREFSRTYLLYPCVVSEYIPRCSHPEELLSAINRLAGSEATRSAISQPGGGLLYALFSNPRLRKHWMAFLTDDVGGSRNFDEAVAKGADRILQMLYEI